MCALGSGEKQGLLPKGYECLIKKRKAEETEIKGIRNRLRISWICECSLLALTVMLSLPQAAVLPKKSVRIQFSSDDE